MVNPIGRNHPLYVYVQQHVASEMEKHVTSRPPNDVLDYLTGLFLEFLRTDSLFAVRSEDGQPVTSVIELLAEADVRIKANSFERERTVHKFIGDFILFWSGVDPVNLNRFRASSGQDIACDYTRQGQESYYVVSTFDHPPYDETAPVFRKLSHEFEAFSFVVNQVNHRIGLYPSANP